jgi:hypothetical protein
MGASIGFTELCSNSFSSDLFFTARNAERRKSPNSGAALWLSNAG